MTAPTPDDAALSLTMAVVQSSPSPLLLLDGDLGVVAASASFCETFEITPPARGASIFGFGGGEWNVPQLRSLLSATATGAAKIDAYEMDLRRPGLDPRRLVVHAQKLVYLDAEKLRLLVAVNDVTEARADARAKDEALARNAVLLQEVRHRVANSLQIIASVLLQNARRTRSQETRGHLQDAHHRVMSVAALERLLSASGEADGDVELHAYFTSLCDSISASMIGEADHIALKVAGGNGMVAARVSVSLGLIVTELVINALKHAFPDGKGGTITVDFEARGPNWLLRVSDDGAGMPRDPALIHTGLGTSIVQALAKQLLATLEIDPGPPGTSVTIEHTQIALVEEADPEDPDWAAAATGRPGG